MKSTDIIFETPFTCGIILKRKSQFTKVTPFTSTDRFVKHVTELANSLQSHQRAIFLICFIYDNPGFQVIGRSTNYEHVKTAVNQSMEMGVEMWQANFNITPNSVTLERYFELSI